MHGDLANGPGSIVTHGDKLWVQVEPQDWHKLSWGKGHGHAIKSLAHTQALESPKSKTLNHLWLQLVLVSADW